MNFPDAIHAVDAADATIERLTLAPDALDVDLEAGALIADGRRISLGSQGVEKLSVCLDAPYTFIRRLGTDVQAAVMLDRIRRGSLGGGPVQLVLDGGHFLAFDRPDLIALSGREVIDAVLQGYGKAEADVEVHDLDVGDGTISFDLVSYTASHTVVANDVVRAGLHVSHSLAGGPATRVEGYLLRLVCSNGMRRRECLGPRRTPRSRRLPTARNKAREAQIERVETLSREAFRAIEGKLASLVRLTAEQVDVEHLARNSLRNAGLSPGRWLERVLDAWRQEGGETNAYTVVNAFTRLGTHGKDLSPRLRDVFCRIGGLLAFREHHLCPHCWSVITDGARHAPGTGANDGGVRRPTQNDAPHEEVNV